MADPVTILGTILAVVGIAVVLAGVYYVGSLRGRWQYRSTEYVVDYRDIDAHARHEAAVDRLDDMIDRNDDGDGGGR